MPLGYIFGHDELVASFVAAMIPHLRGRGFGACRAIGVVDGDNELIAGWVYHHLAPESGVMEISAAALPGRVWVSRETLRTMFDYPFIQCGCQMVVTKVLASHERLLRQFAALGFKFIAVPRLFGRREDGVLCLLYDDDWREGRIFRHIRARDDHREAA